MSNQEKALNYYEVTFYCISKQCFKSTNNDSYNNKKEELKNCLKEIFQNERKEYNFRVKTFSIVDPHYKSVQSMIQLYKKISLKEEKQQNIPSIKGEEEQEKEKIRKEKIEYSSINKEELFSSINFNEKVGNFLNTSYYFVKYISNKKIESDFGETRMIEISRCGYNMEDIIKILGYQQTKVQDHCGFYYQYKYYPIICIYRKLSDGKTDDGYVYLQIKGYYYEKNKDEILSILKNLYNSLSELFVFI